MRSLGRVDCVDAELDVAHLGQEAPLLNREGHLAAIADPRRLRQEERSILGRLPGEALADARQAGHLCELEPRGSLQLDDITDLKLRGELHLKVQACHRRHAISLWWLASHAVAVKPCADLVHDSIAGDGDHVAEERQRPRVRGAVVRLQDPLVQRALRHREHGVFHEDRDLVVPASRELPVALAGQQPRRHRALRRLVHGAFDDGLAPDERGRSDVVGVRRRVVASAGEA
mmetsp:Transcript_3720/g.9618  ORF Transcript_3720/g.9618 Transcript_3720/m.9618 type:complete len:231 (+) Transcript_3720:2431-3123(+)